MILAGLVFLWFRAANSLATQFEDAMKAPNASYLCNINNVSCLRQAEKGGVELYRK